jgi:hypothetical protein
MSSAVSSAVNDEIDQIAKLRLNTEWTNTLVPAQTQTLNAWPLVFLSGTKSHRVTINLEEHKVTYHLTMKPKKTPIQSGLAEIEKGVWMLLGDTWQTTFKAGRKIVRVGERRRNYVQDRKGNSFGRSDHGFDPIGARSLSKVP